MIRHTRVQSDTNYLVGIPGVTSNYEELFEVVPTGMMPRTMGYFTRLGIAFTIDPDARSITHSVYSV